jgi:hypothetical protein
MRVYAGIALLVVVVLCAGCSPVRESAPAAASVEASAPAASSGASSAPASPSRAAISKEAVAYAGELGGVSHRGQTLYLVVISSDTSESVLFRRLEEATPYFGDAANYFVVLDSGWFPELAPGRFVLAEAHSTAEHAQQARDWWAGRVAADWYKAVVEKVTVNTDSPIPVVYVDVEKTD